MGHVIHRILVVDDEENVRFILMEVLRDKGFSVTAAADGRSAIRIFTDDRPDAVLLDQRMPGLGGFETLLELKKIDPLIPVIMLTAFAEISSAVEAIKSGAYDFVTKPPDIEGLTLKIKRSIEKMQLEKDVRRLSSAFGASIEGTLGRSEPIKRTIEQVKQVASSDFSIIIQGETGTGKSTIAELIHNMSARSGKPFTRVDIGLIPETLVESELFGYEKGAFTGAERNKKGYFETASGGTIFIDELENMSLHTQTKLLSVVEQKKIYPMGSTKPVAVDVRVVSAVNTDLIGLVKEKKFREDLFFRLNEFMITLPPLRERMDDIEFLACRFCKEASAELNKKDMEISGEAIKALKAHRWPGNVRELKNVIRRATLLSNNSVMLPGHIGPFPSEAASADATLPLLPLKEVSAVAAREAERAAIAQALKISNGNKSKAAIVLQVDYKTLLTKIKQYDIS